MSPGPVRLRVRVSPSMPSNLGASAVMAFSHTV